MLCPPFVFFVAAVIANPLAYPQDSTDGALVSDNVLTSPETIEEPSIQAISPNPGCISDASTSSDGDDDNFGIYRWATSAFCKATDQETTTPNVAPRPKVPANFFGGEKTSDPACAKLRGRPWLLTCEGPEVVTETTTKISGFEVTNCVEGKSCNLL